MVTGTLISLQKHIWWKILRPKIMSIIRPNLNQAYMFKRSSVADGLYWNGTYTIEELHLYNA